MASPGSTKKVATGSLAGSITVILTWVLRTFIGLEIPAEVAAALATVIGLGTAYTIKEDS